MITQQTSDLQKCILCGHQTQMIRHPRFDMTFLICSNCKLIHKDPSIHPTDEVAKRQYDFHQNDDHDPGYVNFLTNFIDTALYPFIQKGKLLDFGSGPNPVLSRILNRDYGFDVDIYDLYYASEKIYQNRIYDAITATEVIEHLANPLETFKCFHRQLRSGGILALMTLFHPDDLMSFFDWFYIRDLTHVSFYRPETIAYIADLVGFEVIDTNHHRTITLKKT